MKTFLFRISTFSPGRPMTRLMKSRSGSSGNLKTTTWPRAIFFLPKSRSSRGPSDGEYTSLFTSRWSPMSRFSCIDPVGILKACTAKVRTKRARSTATTIDSRYSRATDLRMAGALGIRLRRLPCAHAWTF